MDSDVAADIEFHNSNTKFTTSSQWEPNNYSNIIVTNQISKTVCDFFRISKYLSLYMFIYDLIVGNTYRILMEIAPRPT